MNIIVLGKPYPYKFQWEGAKLIFTPNAISIIFAISNPHTYEIDSFLSHHPIKIGILRWNRLGVLLFDFRQGFNFDVPFDAGIELSRNVPELVISNDSSRIKLTLVGVDSGAENRVFGIRLITTSSRVSKYVSQIISTQKSTPISQSDYDEMVLKTYLKYPTYRSLVNAALANDKAGE